MRDFHMAPEYSQQKIVDEKAFSVGDFIARSSFWIPDSFVASAWVEHAPFAFWLIEKHRPLLLVELGTHHGFSFLAFCQAVAPLGLATRCFAVDTWKGDEHTGLYGDEVYQALWGYHQRRYSGFSQLVRATFDEAVGSFEDGSIDLLHIDGRHYNEDVRHDFETWRPKLSKRAIVLFHNTSVFEREFGVVRLWNELCGNFPQFEFIHGHGLGLKMLTSEPRPGSHLMTLRWPVGVTRSRGAQAVGSRGHN